MITIVDGPGADAAAIVLRNAGLEVEIFHPPKVLSFWNLARAYSGGEVNSIHWSLACVECRSLWRDVSAAILSQPFIDPEIVALMDAGEFVWAPLDLDDSIRPGLARCGGTWSITSGPDMFAEVSDRLAAAWLAEFDGGEK